MGMDLFFEGERMEVEGAKVNLSVSKYSGGGERSKPS